MAALAGWQNFYVIVGGAAGALIGLQFVVLSLISQTRRASTNPTAGSAFSTPTIVHFSAVLALAGILCAPWERIGPAALSWGTLGAGGIVYTSMVIRRIRAQKVYRPEFEDWLFHGALPMAAYVAMAVLAFVARFRLQGALFGVGAAALLLLLAGIHNAWDAVTYHVFAPSKD